MLVKRILRTHDLDHAMQYFCEQIEHMQKDIFISFSAKGYSPSVEKSPLLTEEVKGRLYAALIHLCAHA